MLKASGCDIEARDLNSKKQFMKKRDPLWGGLLSK
jgi:hypothetical protein